MLMNMSYPDQILLVLSLNEGTCTHVQVFICFSQFETGKDRPKVTWNMSQCEITYLCLAVVRVPVFCLAIVLIPPVTRNSLQLCFVYAHYTWSLLVRALSKTCFVSACSS